MRSILRDPGAEVIVGLLSFSVSFIAIGLALVALAQDRPMLLCYSYIAFAFSILLFGTAIIAIIVLVRHFAKVKSYIEQIGAFLHQGRLLRDELASIREIPQWTEEMQNKVPKWKAEVQKWLDENIPEYAPLFDLEGLATTFDRIGKNAAAGAAAEHLEGRMQNLKEILRDIRQ